MKKKKNKSEKKKERRAERAARISKKAIKVLGVLVALLIIVNAGIFIYFNYYYQDKSVFRTLPPEEQQAVEKEIADLRGKLEGNPPEKFDLSLQLALKYETIGDLKNAVRVYEKIGQFSPKNSTSFSNLGNVLSRLGKYDLAETAFKTALANSPDDRQLYRNLDNLYLYDWPNYKENIKSINFKPFAYLSQEIKAIKWGDPNKIKQKAAAILDQGLQKFGETDTEFLGLKAEYYKEIGDAAKEAEVRAKIMAPAPAEPSQP